jgi:hypothetical protein
MTVRPTARKRVFALLFTGLITLCGWLVLHRLPSRDEPFSSSRWKSVRIGAGQFMRTGPPDTVRLHMVNNLLQTHLRAGMKQEQVLTLLGEPDSGDGTGDGPIDVYWLEEKPPSLWDWLGFPRRHERKLLLEYSEKDHRLLNIAIK